MYDGVCNLCNNAVNFIIDHDKAGRFRFASLQSAYASNVLASANVTHPFPDSIILVKKDNQLKFKSTAALHIAKKLSGAWPLCYIFMLLPVFIRDYVYDIIAKNRYRWFGRHDACKMPSPELQRLFLDV